MVKPLVSVNAAVVRPPMVPPPLTVPALAVIVPFGAEAVPFTVSSPPEPAVSETEPLVLCTVTPELMMSGLFAVRLKVPPAVVLAVTVVVP